MFASCVKQFKKRKAKNSGWCFLRSKGLKVPFAHTLPQMQEQFKYKICIFQLYKKTAVEPMIKLDRLLFFSFSNDCTSVSNKILPQH